MDFRVGRVYRVSPVSLDICLVFRPGLGLESAGLVVAWTFVLVCAVCVLCYALMVLVMDLGYFSFYAFRL